MDNTKLMIAISKLNIELNKQLGSDIYNYGITPTEFKIISHLYVKKRSRTQKLGEIALITSGAITYFINKLEKKGYVLRVRDEHDKRISWVELTNEGVMFYEDMRPKHIKHLNELFSVFTNEEVTTMFQVIRTFQRKLHKE